MGCVLQDNSHSAAVESKAIGAEGNSVGQVEHLQHQIAGLQTQLKDSKRQHRYGRIYFTLAYRGIRSDKQLYFVCVQLYTVWELGCEFSTLKSFDQCKDAADVPNLFPNIIKMCIYRQEVSDLRRMLLNNSHGSSHGACTLEDATELEYLRNILFEYMMGKEPMVSGC